MNNQIDFGKLLLRITFGGLMLTHGVPKLMKLFSSNPIEFPDPFGLGPSITLGLTVFAEFICAILVIIGYKVKWSALILVFTMLVAAFMIHGGDPIGKKELALLYGGAFLAISMIGAGKYSIDGK